MIEWIGYQSTEIKRCKNSYIYLLKENFENITDFKLLNSKDFKEFSKSQNWDLENEETNSHNKTKHLIISPDCFKQSLMLLKTKKSKEIKKYYIELEKIYKFYTQYQNKYKDLENIKILNLLKEKDNELKEKDEILLKEREIYKLLKKHTTSYLLLLISEYIYVITTQRYARDDTFKIGRAKNPSKRIIQYNTGKVPGDKYYYCYMYKCVNSINLEASLFIKLQNFKVKNSNEMYKIKFQSLKNILDYVLGHDKKDIDYINNFIANDYEASLDLPTIIPEDIFAKNSTTNADEYTKNSTTNVKKDNTKPKKIYKKSNIVDQDKINKKKLKNVCHKCNRGFVKPSELEKHINRKSHVM